MTFSNFGVFILFIISVGIFISVLKYITIEKNTRRSTYADILLDLVKTLIYKKSVLVNDYPIYQGNLEENDANEYISYLQSGILDILNSKGEV